MRITTADDKRRVTLPGVKRGDTFQVTTDGPGRYLLIRLIPAKKGKFRETTGPLKTKPFSKVFTGTLPKVDIAEAVNAARHYTR